MATGKISRLPREIREQLNRKLDDNEPGKRLVVWLNELPTVRALLATEFGGAVINAQNLTNWKQGGYRDWRLREEMRVFVPPADTEVTVVTTEQLATVVAAHYLVAVREWQQSPVSGQRRWRQMRVILHDVMKLRGQEQAEQRLALAWARMEWQQKTQTRQAMAGMLGELEAWPEVKAAFHAAFACYEQRKTAESGSIKVNQGGQEIKNVEGQREVEDCCPVKSSLTKEKRGEKVCLSSNLGKQSDFGEENTTSPRPSPPLRGGEGARGVRLNHGFIRADDCVHLNEAESGQIKVNQGSEKIKFLEGLTELKAHGDKRTIYFAEGREPGEDRSACVRKRCRRYRSATAVQNRNGQVQTAREFVEDEGRPTPQSAGGAGKIRRSGTDSTSYGLPRYAENHSARFLSPFRGRGGKQSGRSICLDEFQQNRLFCGANYTTLASPELIL